jgi:hypothetical protein
LKAEVTVGFGGLDVVDAVVAGGVLVTTGVVVGLAVVLVDEVVATTGVVAAVVVTWTTVVGVVVVCVPPQPMSSSGAMSRHIRILFFNSEPPGYPSTYLILGSISAPHYYFTTSL